MERMERAGESSASSFAPGSSGSSADVPPASSDDAAAQQYVLPSADPPGCPGFAPHALRPRLCVQCLRPALQHASVTRAQALTALATSSEAERVPTLIVPGVYLGGYRAAMNAPHLERLGVTHVLNAAKGIAQMFPTFREHDGRFVYLRLELEDRVDEQCDAHFEAACAFVATALASGGVLVHCAQGASRSAALVLAYLMAAHRLALRDALALVTERRPCVRPNDGFMRQLALLDADRERLDALRRVIDDATRRARATSRSATEPGGIADGQPLLIDEKQEEKEAGEAAVHAS